MANLGRHGAAARCADSVPDRNLRFALLFPLFPLLCFYDLLFKICDICNNLCQLKFFAALHTATEEMLEPVGANTRHILELRGSYNPHRTKKARYPCVPLPSVARLRALRPGLSLPISIPLS
jgi:hypothetical protein